MKEVIEIETVDGLKKIGYTSMMAPSNEKESNKVFKMLRLLSSDEKEGDIHFFQRNGEAWVLAPDYSFINLNGNQKLLELYQNLPRNRNIDFCTFIELIARALCL